MTTKYDKILIILVGIFSVISIIATKKLFNNIDDKYIYIEVNGQKYKEILLDPSFKKTIEIKTDFGKNILKIENESVRVIEASCPDKLDVKQGRISQPGEVIVCLPNKLLIEIRGKETKEKDSEVDYISH